MKKQLILFAIAFNIITGCRETPGTRGQETDFPPRGIVLQTLSNKDTLIYGVSHNKANVYVFLSPECPLSQSYSLTLNQLNNNYKNDHICFYGIFSGTFHSTDEIKKFKEKYGIEFPLFQDMDYNLARKLGATTTPEAFVLDSKGIIVYSGRIDNWAYEVSKKRQVITEHNLEDALESIVNNKTVAINKTKAVGCFIEYPKK